MVKAKAKKMNYEYNVELGKYNDAVVTASTKVEEDGSLIIDYWIKPTPDAVIMHHVVGIHIGGDFKKCNKDKVFSIIDCFVGSDYFDEELVDSILAEKPAAGNSGKQA